METRDMVCEQWVLIDTETTGLVAPIFVVELAAQRMKGWVADGPPFRRLLNQNQDIPSEASRVHGYTREILERDGDPAADVYRDFAAYVGGLPLVAYNLEYDLTSVLEPEWQRLGIKPIGTAGFCALKLAQRLLDPVPAGNCKLQTLRQYYRLPERGAHTALGDVETVADLLSGVLKPIAESRGITSWDAICRFVESEWFPTRIAFGKFKGRHYQDARTDRALMGWIEWLAQSKNDRSARMGCWYLQQLESNSDGSDDVIAAVLPSEDLAPPAQAQNSSETGVVVFVDLDAEKLRLLVEAARTQLAELETAYTKDKHAVEQTQASLFKLVRSHYQRRDQLRLLVAYRERFLNTLLSRGDEEAAEIAEEYAQARAGSDKDYDDAALVAERRIKLSEDEEQELKALWKKLVRLYHPDRFADQPEKLATYTQLTSAINKARDEGNIALLREIANDPHGFILRSGWSGLDFGDVAESRKLRRLLDTLQMEIVDKLEKLNTLRASPEYELHKLSANDSSFLEEVAAKQRATIDAEIWQLEALAEKLRIEIIELSGDEATKIA